MPVPRRSAEIAGHREGRAVEGAGLYAKQRCSSTESLRAGETASESVVRPKRACAYQQNRMGVIRAVKFYDITLRVTQEVSVGRFHVGLKWEVLGAPAITPPPRILAGTRAYPRTPARSSGYLPAEDGTHSPTSRS